LEWFNSYSFGIDQWTLENGEKESDMDATTLKPMTDITTSPTGKTPVTGKPTTSTPQPSSATLNAHNSLIILQLAVFTVIIKTYFL